MLRGHLATLQRPSCASTDSWISRCRCTAAISALILVEILLVREPFFRALPFSRGRCKIRRSPKAEAGNAELEPHQARTLAANHRAHRYQAAQRGAAGRGDEVDGLFG